MTSPQLEAASRSTRTEEEIRIGRLPDWLLELKRAADRAHDAFHSHHYEGDIADIGARILFDIEEKQLLRMSLDASAAYVGGLKTYLDGSKT